MNAHEDYHVTITPEEVMAAPAPDQAYWEALERQRVPTTPTVVGGLALEFAALFGVTASICFMFPRSSGFATGSPSRLWSLGFVLAGLAIVAYLVAILVAWAASARGPERFRRLGLATRIISRIIPPKSLRRKLHKLESEVGSAVVSQELVWPAIALLVVDGALVITGQITGMLLTGMVPLALMLAMLVRQANLVDRSEGAEREVRQAAAVVLESMLLQTLVVASVHLGLAMFLRLWFT